MYRAYRSYPKAKNCKAVCSSHVSLDILFACQMPKEWTIKEISTKLVIVTGWECKVEPSYIIHSPPDITFTTIFPVVCICAI